MPVLSPNQPLDQADPELLVENRLQPGFHRFALTVVDGRGRVSERAEWVVEVRPTRQPLVPERNPT